MCVCVCVCMCVCVCVSLRAADARYFPAEIRRVAVAERVTASVSFTRRESTADQRPNDS